MKHFFLILLLANILQLSAQTDKTIEYGGITREYLEYVPAIYDGSEAVPIILCLHGLGDTKEGFFTIGMNYIADTANFILLFPEALDDTINIPIFGEYITGTAWNSGASQNGIVINDDIDDVGFLSTIIEDTKALYNIDESRIFVTGFSMGGFMSNRMACEMSSSFAAIATVSGTIGASLNCNPEFPISACHFHGTSDATVAYTSNSYGSDAEELVEYWRAHNNCELTATETNLPDIASDGKTVDHFKYANGDENTTVEFYKVNNGEHNWLFLPNNDISYCFEIWKFFRSQEKLNVGVKGIEHTNTIELFPNPVTDQFQISSEKAIKKVDILSLDGRLVKSFSPKSTEKTFDVSDLKNGAYIVSVDGNKQKILINR